MASNKKHNIDLNTLQHNLCDLRDHISRKKIFQNHSLCFEAAQEIFKNPLLLYEDIDFSKLGRNPEIITDDNMITEYKYGRGF